MKIGRSRVVKAAADRRWLDVETREYKAERGGFRGITRQTILGGEDQDEGLPNAVRYFEIAPGGYSSLERHQHAHVVIVLYGSGAVLLDKTVSPVAERDCVYVAPGSAHQFHASETETLGFLCIVDRVRDRPSPLSIDEIEELAKDPAVRRYLKR